MSNLVQRAPGQYVPPSITERVNAVASRSYAYLLPLSLDLVLTASSANDATRAAIEQSRFTIPHMRLAEVFAEAAELARMDSNEQAEPTASTFANAYNLLRSLPPGIDIPEPVVEPSGKIAWQWDRGPGKYLILAMNGAGQLEYTWAIDGNESWGTKDFTGRLAPDLLDVLSYFTWPHGSA